MTSACGTNGSITTNWMENGGSWSVSTRFSKQDIPRGVLWYFLIYIGLAHFLGPSPYDLSCWWDVKHKHNHFLGVQHFELQQFFSSEKWIFFEVWKLYGYFLGVIAKLDYILGAFLCVLGSFLQNGNIFLGVAKIKKKCFGYARYSWYF